MLLEDVGMGGLWTFMPLDGRNRVGVPGRIPLSSGGRGRPPLGHPASSAKGTSIF